MAFWLYSSGTTGFPKGAIHLHHDMIVAADRYGRETLGLAESDVSFSVAKLFFAYGLGNGLYFPLRTGGTTVLLPDRPTPQAVFRNHRLPSADRLLQCAHQLRGLAAGGREDAAARVWATCGIASRPARPCLVICS